MTYQHSPLFPLGEDKTPYRLVTTDQPLGAIAVYLCEPESDDGAVENGLIGAPAVGDDFPIWRVR